MGKTTQCDFGQYKELWKNHTDDCKKIIRITNDYIIYIDKQNNIDWETTEAYDAAEAKDEKIEREKILSHCLIAEHKPTGGLSETSIINFKTIIGEAIVNSLKQNYASTTEILKLAEEFRIDRITEKSREWHLTFTILLSAIAVTITLAINIEKTSIHENLLPYINAGAWAIAGACLSIILRSGNLQHASYAGKQLHFIESGCRLVGGFITGQIVYLGITSEILFSNLTNHNSSQSIIYLLTLIAGASERFAPSIITKIDDSSFPSKATKEN